MDYLWNADVWRAMPLTLLGLLSLSAIVYVLLANGILMKHFNISADKVVVFVTAHPDDECMFFAPTVLKVAERDPKNVHLLCLTTGNFYNKGQVREKELYESGKILGIPACNIEILNNSSFLDGCQHWDFSALLPELTKYIKKVNPDYIFTFDNYGVSGHTNHIATSDAIRQLYKYHQSNDKIPAIFELESVPIYRKYLSFMDVPTSVMNSHLVFTSPPSDFFKAQRAMLCHRSQLVWYRWLYIIFSRYMLINTFNALSLESSSDYS